MYVVTLIVPERPAHFSGMDPLVTQTLDRFQDDIGAKFQRYSLNGKLSSAGWEYLWKSVPDLPVDDVTLKRIFNDTAPTSDPKRCVSRTVVSSDANTVSILFHSISMSLAAFLEALVVVARAAFPREGRLP